ncbi:MAG: hypothetical protein HPY76_08355 [Anaerolineae bacterium]|nr:hypothetical protein [Anaerolineae bacterium]
MASLGLGSSSNFSGKEAAREAALHALDQVGTSRPVWALVFAGDTYALADLQQGLAGALGPIPYWGFSTPAIFYAQSEFSRSVVVLVMTGTDRKSHVYSESFAGEDASGVGKRLIHSLRDITASNVSGMLLACNGMWGDPVSLLNGLTGFDAPVLGCVTSVARPPAFSYLIAPGTNASSGLSAAILSGRFRIATGWGHGWRPLTSSRRVTGAEGNTLRSVENQPAAQFYADTFGYSVADWMKPPLNEIVRLYPLGVQSGMFTSEIQLRSPVFVNPDGSIGMNTAIPTGKMVKLMLGDPDLCLEQAQAAGRQARHDLGAARPIFALAFVDTAWRMLFKANPQSLTSAIQAGLEDVPFVGAYTHGQIVTFRVDAPPTLLNQHIQVVLVGEN